MLLNAIDGQSNLTNFRLISHHDSGSDACNAIFSRGRGTTAAPTAVTSGDLIYDLVWAGHDGANFVFAAGITGAVNDTVSAGVVPGRLDFKTRSSSGTVSTPVKIESRKSVFQNMLQLQTYANETAADAAIGGSGNRVNGMMYYDSGSSKIKAVAGGSWTALH